MSTPPAPTPSEARTVVVTCDAGHRVTGIPALVGQACWGCGEAWRLADEVDEMIRRSVEARG